MDKEYKYKGLKAICDTIFTLIAVGTVFWNPEFSIMTGIVLFTQNVMVCYNELNIDNNSRLFYMNIITLIADGISLFLIIGIYVAGFTIYIQIVKYCSLICLFRTIMIFAHYAKISKDTETKEEDYGSNN